MILLVALVLGGGTIMLALRGRNTDLLDEVLESAIGPLVGIGSIAALTLVYWLILTAIFGGGR